MRNMSDEELIRRHEHNLTWDCEYPEYSKKEMEKHVKAESGTRDELLSRLDQRDRARVALRNELLMCCSYCSLSLKTYAEGCTNLNSCLKPVIRALLAEMEAPK